MTVLTVVELPEAEGLRAIVIFGVNDDAKGDYRRVEVLMGPGRRRRWSAEEKDRIVEESLVPGARVSEVDGAGKFVRSRFRLATSAFGKVRPWQQGRQRRERPTSFRSRPMSRDLHRLRALRPQPRQSRSSWCQLAGAVVRVVSTPKRFVRHEPADDALRADEDG
jgi:transposase-like protein